MLSGKLVHLIETQWDKIMANAIDQVQREPDMVHIREYFKTDSQDWAQVVLQNLGHWLLAGNEEELARKYEELGKLRFEEEVPLHESVRGLCILREKTLDYVEQHLFDKNTLALYAEEELDRRMGRFFDLLTIHMVRGYEKALRSAMTPRSTIGAR
jgi:hypothetical protein